MKYPQIYDRLREHYSHVGDEWLRKACMDAEARASQLDRIPDELQQVLVALTVQFTFADERERVAIRSSMRTVAAHFYPEGTPP